MLDSSAAVEQALARYPDPPGLLEDLEERLELRRRVAWLAPEEALVLVRWYVDGAKPEVIARDLSCSVRHVYRQRLTAIERLVALGRTEDLDDADLSEFV